MSVHASHEIQSFYVYCLYFFSVLQLNHSKYTCIHLFSSVFQVISDAAGQGVTISGTKTFNNWNWPNAVIFAATVITTIGKLLFFYSLMMIL